jgi:hypothetical protein
MSTKIQNNEAAYAATKLSPQAVVFRAIDPARRNGPESYVGDATIHPAVQLAIFNAQKETDDKRDEIICRRIITIAAHLLESGHPELATHLLIKLSQQYSVAGHRADELPKILAQFTTKDSQGEDLAPPLEEVLEMVDPAFPVPTLRHFLFERLNKLDKESGEHDRVVSKLLAGPHKAAALAALEWDGLSARAKPRTKSEIVTTDGNHAQENADSQASDAFAYFTAFQDYILLHWQNNIAILPESLQGLVRKLNERQADPYEPFSKCLGTYVFNLVEAGQYSQLQESLIALLGQTPTTKMVDAYIFDLPNLDAYTSLTVFTWIVEHTQVSAESLVGSHGFQKLCFRFLANQDRTNIYGFLRLFDMRINESLNLSETEMRQLIDELIGRVKAGNGFYFPAYFVKYLTPADTAILQSFAHQQHFPGKLRDYFTALDQLLEDARTASSPAEQT